MDTPAFPTPETPAPPTNLEALERSVRVLRGHLIVVLCLLLVFTGSVSLFVFKQVLLVRRQSVEFTRMVAGYNRNEGPQMNEFVAKLKDFSRAYPDFAPILKKYVKGDPSRTPQPPVNPSPAK